MITAIRLPTTGAKNKTSNNGRLKKKKKNQTTQKKIQQRAKYFTARYFNIYDIREIKKGYTISNLETRLWKTLY